MDNPPYVKTPLAEATLSAKARKATALTLLRPKPHVLAGFRVLVWGLRLRVNVGT